jgi:hypothetical protein
MFELVAQLVEQRPFKAWVLGSSPSELTTLLAAAPRLLALDPCPSTLPYSLGQKCTSLVPRSRSAADSAVMSRCGMPSISNPTINLRTVAERSSGG